MVVQEARSSYVVSYLQEQNAEIDYLISSYYDRTA